MEIMIPGVFIFLFLLWFLILGIIDKNKKMIIIFGIIVLLYAIISCCGIQMLISISKQFS
ncbi:hypothetical protein SAMN04487760_10738 [Lachnospiraceae bacterium G41]|jgi:hypothetical protein|nr:hypothetical protein SAMN04487760_10738 [Lachnospiraceae bacterium G41]